MQIEFDEQFYDQLADKVADRLLPVLSQKLENHESRLPLILTRADIKELMEIGENKTSELMSILPKIQGYSHPKVPSKAFLEWIDQNTEWVEEHAPSNKLSIV